MTIGDHIKKARKSKGLTQEELAKLLGVTFAMIGQYERGERNPKKETIQRIADALNVNVGELIYGADIKLEKPIKEYNLDELCKLEDKNPSDLSDEESAALEKFRSETSQLFEEYQKAFKQNIDDISRNLGELGKEFQKTIKQNFDDAYRELNILPPNIEALDLSNSAERIGWKRVVDVTTSQTNDPIIKDKLNKLMTEDDEKIENDIERFIKVFGMLTPFQFGKFVDVLESLPRQDILKLIEHAESLALQLKKNEEEGDDK